MKTLFKKNGLLPKTKSRYFSCLLPFAFYLLPFISFSQETKKDTTKVTELKEVMVSSSDSGAKKATKAEKAKAAAKVEETTTENAAIDLSYGLGWGLLKCKYGSAFFKEGHDDAWRNYNINFIDRGIAIIIMTNSANGELIFKELLATLIGDTFTPWKWESYFPYDYKN